MITIDEIIASYEATARKNRPDWDQFIKDAQADPCGIGCEMVDHAHLMHELRMQTSAELVDEDDDIHDAAYLWVERLDNPRRIPGTNKVKEVRIMRLLHDNGQYILDHGRDERIVTIKTSSEQFVIITDATGIEQVIDRATFDESAVLVERWDDGHFLCGHFNKEGIRAVDQVNGGVKYTPEHYGKGDTRWAIDLAKVPESAYVFGYNH